MSDKYLWNGLEPTYETEKPSLVTDPVLITGVARSGTTLLGKVLSTLNGVEYEFEPWLLLELLAMRDFGFIKGPAAAKLLKRYFDELMMNHVLCRNVNLRETDDSRKDIAVGNDEIKRRWESLSDVEDARRFISGNNSVLMLKYPDLIPFLDNIYEMVSPIRVLHIIRNPFDVAMSLVRKGWFDDNYLKNDNMLLRKKTRDGRIYPWWVRREDEGIFRSSDVYSRSLLCWVSQMESLTGVELSQKEREGTYKYVFYEDLLATPEESLRELISYIGRGSTDRTTEILSTICRDKIGKMATGPGKSTDRSLVDRTYRMMEKLGYGIGPSGFTLHNGGML